MLSCHKSFLTPLFLACRCSAHVADVTLKMKARSKTMNVDKARVFYKCIRTFIKHFQCSVKDNEILDTCLAILELGEIHLTSWCPTKMAHFFLGMLCS